MTTPDPLTAYLATNDAPCPGCYRNLRGQTITVCPACLEKLELRQVRTWHAMHGDAKTIPMPIPGTPEAEDVESYLAINEARCVGCGYALHRLRTDVCPECSRQIRISEFVTAPSCTYRIEFCAKVAVAINVLPLAIIGLTSILSASRAYTYGGDTAAIVLPLMLLGVCGILIATFLTKVHKLFLRSLWWFAVINPVTYSLALVILAAVLAKVFVG